MTSSVSKSLARIDLGELETFVAVAKFASFRKAADYLNLSQPSVTNRVHRLEATLHAALLIRTTRKVELTEDGEKLLREAELALSGLGAIVDSFLARAESARHRVTVAATPLLAALFLPPVIRNYLERFKDVEVHLQDARYADVLEAVDTGAADIGVVSVDALDSRFTVEPIGSDDVIMVVPLGHRLVGMHSVGVQQLVGESLMLIEQYRPMLDRIVDAMVQGGLPPPHARLVADMTTLSGLLDAQMGIGLLSLTAARHRHSPPETIMHLDGLDLRRNFALIFSSRRALNATAESFGRYLHTALAAFWRP